MASSPSCRPGGLFVPESREDPQSKTTNSGITLLLYRLENLQVDLLLGSAQGSACTKPCQRGFSACLGRTSGAPRRDTQIPSSAQRLPGTQSQRKPAKCVCAYLCVVYMFGLSRGPNDHTNIRISHPAKIRGMPGMMFCRILILIYHILLAKYQIF